MDASVQVVFGEESRKSGVSLSRCGRKGQGDPVSAIALTAVLSCMDLPISDAKVCTTVHKLDHALLELAGAPVFEYTQSEQAQVRVVSK